MPTDTTVAPPRGARWPSEAAGGTAAAPRLTSRPSRSLPHRHHLQTRSRWFGRPSAGAQEGRSRGRGPKRLGPRRPRVSGAHEDDPAAPERRCPQDARAPARRELGRAVPGKRPTEHATPKAFPPGSRRPHFPGEKGLPGAPPLTLEGGLLPVCSWRRGPRRQPGPPAASGTARSGRTSASQDDGSEWRGRASPGRTPPPVQRPLGAPTRPWLGAALAPSGPRGMARPVPACGTHADVLFRSARLGPQLSHTRWARGRLPWEGRPRGLPLEEAWAARMCRGSRFPKGGGAETSRAITPPPAGHPSLRGLPGRSARSLPAWPPGAAAQAGTGTAARLTIR